VTLLDGTYSWRVRASNGLWGSYCSTWTVTVAAPSGGATLVSPINGTAVTSTPLAYIWEVEPETTEYRLYINNLSGRVRAMARCSNALHWQGMCCRTITQPCLRQRNSL
ncbi:MAG: hypothetical protein JXB30_09415, partial [Anaerolineae bacterium]|nr:hypothetical protein [Anaerolineae bacterium]